MGSVAPCPVEKSWGEGHNHLEGPNPASAVRGGPRPRTGSCFQRLPSEKACLLWKMKWASTPGVLSPCQALACLAPLLTHGQPKPRREHPQAECSSNQLCVYLLGLCQGLPHCLARCWGTRWDPQSQRLQPGWGWWDLPPLCLTLELTPLATTGIQAKGLCHPTATCHPVPTPCHPPVPCHSPTGRMWDPPWVPSAEQPHLLCPQP